MSEARVDGVAARFTIGVPAHAAEPDLARTLASLKLSGDRTGCRYEIVVVVNGPAEATQAVAGVREFASRAGLALTEGGEARVPEPGRACDPVIGEVDRPGTSVGAAGGGSASPTVRLLRLTMLSKVAAWNAIRSAARAPVLVFADADVRVAPSAIGILLSRLADEPGLAAVGSRESAVLESGDGVVARVAALPYRFDFSNVPGRLYALRATAIVEPMPAQVVAEDAYLTVKLGRSRFAKELAAVVYLRPPLTWRDYLRQRVRNEVGKLQLAREFPDLLRTHGFGRYPWHALLRGISPREYPLVVASLAVRLYARIAARNLVEGGFRAGWEVLDSTKSWSPPDGPGLEAGAGHETWPARAPGGGKASI